MATLTISDQVYQRLQMLAQQRRQTPEALLEALLSEQEQQPERQIFHNLEEMMRANGMSEEDIAWVQAQPVELASDDEYERADV
jgi:predicted transcriptional regulator